jgi:2-polyprenyl-3-methyl-5-hydroxy-6-metoxy-1,4-benzoquinol methylase
MTIRTDPEGNEIRALSDLAELDEREVLEIGCGDGRLTWRYADKVAHVTAIDPFADGIKRARERLPDTLRSRVDFHHIAFDDFADASRPSAFDITILSWSLC